MNFKYYPVIFASFFLGSHAIAQTGKTVHETAKGTVNFTELANYERAHPVPFTRKPPQNEDADENVHRSNPPADPALVRQFTQPLETGTGHEHHAYLPVSASPADTFQAKLSDGTTIPPDSHGGVDSQYALTAINSSISIRRRSTHASVSSVSLDGFWGSSLMGSGNSSFDPRAFYDAYSRRWIIVAVCVSGSMTNSKILVAVSATNDPTGTWYKFAVITDATNATWLDYPTVGYNKQWIAVSGNYFTTAGSSTNSVLYVFNKSLLLAGTSATATRILPSGFTVCPAVTLDTAEANMFVIDVYNNAAGQLRLRKLTGTPVAAALSGTIGYPTTTTHWQYQGNSTGSDFAPQLGTTHKLQTNDDRISSCVMRNGEIWCAHNAFLPSSTPTRCSVMWWQIDSNATVAQHGTIDDATATLFHSFPSISVNKNNDALVGYSYLSGSIYPACAYSLHMNSDGANTMRPEYVYRHGLESYYQTFGGSDNRWGDYSATCVDPRNDLDFWTIQETTPSGPSNYWDTWWAYVTVCATRPAPTLVTSPASLCESATGLFVVSSDTGATSYNWTVSGTGWSGSSTTDSAYLTAGTGVATVTVSVINSCGAGSALTFTVAPATIPNITAINTLVTPCVGSSTALFSATPGGATTYNWQIAGGIGWTGSSTTDSITTNVGTDTTLLVVSATNSCGTGTPDTLKIWPGIVPSPITSLTTPTVFCIGNTAVLTTPADAGATSYNWSVSGTGWSGTSTTNSVTVTVGTGPGTITVTPVDACGSGTGYTISGVTPTAAPSASFSLSAHSTYVSTNVTVTYTGSAPSGSTYSWNFDGGIAVPGGATPGPQTVHWTTAGTYTITLTVTNGGCSATYTDTVHVSPGVGVAQLNNQALTADIVPNPNNGTFTVLFNQPVPQAISVKITDMQGREVYNRSFDRTNGQGLQITTNDLPPGTYAASIYTDSFVITKKITITK